MHARQATALGAGPPVGAGAPRPRPRHPAPGTAPLTPGTVDVNGLPQVLALYSTDLGWFTGTGENAFTPILISSFVYGAAIVLVVLFEPGGLAAIGRRIAGLTRRGKDPR